MASTKRKAISTRCNSEIVTIYKGSRLLMPYYSISLQWCTMRYNDASVLLPSVRQIAAHSYYTMVIITEYFSGNVATSCQHFYSRTAVRGRWTHRTVEAIVNTRWPHVRFVCSWFRCDHHHRRRRGLAKQKPSEGLVRLLFTSVCWAVTSYLASAGITEPRFGLVFGLGFCCEQQLLRTTTEVTMAEVTPA